MRQELRKMNDVRATFRGTFVRYGTKTNWHGYPEKTILLKDIKDTSGKVVTDHLWFNCTLGFQKLALNENDEVVFDARVKDYIKGYRGYREDVYDKPVEVDYRLSHPTKIHKADLSNNRGLEL
jgi:hypothetical protein